MRTSPAARPCVTPEELNSGERRVIWVDTAKGFGIVLVVVGHVLRGLVNGHVIIWTVSVRFLDAWIYAFHMPLFFFLSGLFLYRSTARPWGMFVSDKLRTIAYPYFVWSVITLLIKAALRSIPNYPRDLSDFTLILYAPIEQYWFLYVLFILTVTMGLLLKFGVRPGALFLLTLLFYPGLLPISESLAILEVARSFAPYLALGVVASWTWSSRRISEIPIAILTVAAVLGFVCPALVVKAEMSEQYVLHLLIAVSGTIGVVAIAILLYRAKLDGAIRFLGRYSLEIFVAHTIASAAVRIALLKVVLVTSPEVHLVLGIVAGLYIPVALSLALERVGVRSAFTLPKLGRLKSRNLK